MTRLYLIFLLILPALACGQPICEDPCVTPSPTYWQEATEMPTATPAIGISPTRAEMTATATYQPSYIATTDTFSPPGVQGGKERP